MYINMGKVLFYALALFCLGSVDAFSASFNVPASPTLSLIRSNNGVVRLAYQGPTNFQYLLRVSSDLASWSTLSTNVASSNTMFFVDNAATNQPRRFYSATALKTAMFYYGTSTGNEAGKFLLVVRTNNVGTLFGFNTSRNKGERTLNMQFDAEGKYCGPLFAQTSGCLTITPTGISGNYTNNLNQTGTLTGTNRFNFGNFRNAAGLYSANFAGAGICPGTIHALVSADGLIFFYVINNSGTYTDASIGQAMGGTGGFGDPSPPPSSIHITGTLNPNTAVISGSYIHACPDRTGAGGISMSRSERVF